ncbi:MAG: ABC transporter ATP-binding protein [Myxococcota bacterium]
MSKTATVHRMLMYFKPHRAAFALALLLMGLQALIPGTLVLLIERVLDQVLIEQDANLLMVMPLALIALYAVRGALTVGRGMLTREIAWEVITRLRGELFRHLLRMDHGWHQRHPTGAILARLTNDVTTIQYGVSGIVTAVQQPLTLVALIAAAAWMNPWLTLTAVAVLPLVAWPIARFGARLRHSSKASLDNMAGLSSTASETLTGIRVVASFAGEDERQAKFDHANEEQRALQMKAFLAQLMPGPVVELIAAIGVGAVLWLGGKQVFAGEIKAGELIAFMVALGLLNEPLKGISKIHSLTQRALAGAESIFAILDTEPSIQDRGTHPGPSTPASIRFIDVNFDYGDGPVLNGVDLEIGAGEVVALVGASGAGKSTIANMVPRFIEPTQGNITINGINISDIQLSELRRSVAVVSQETFLFNDSVAENIRFGTSATQEEIEHAARIANAHAFISNLPLGYQTRIDELGMRLSGGQRQRICIARAVLRNAPILILDEATSSLDAESEALVQQALERLMEDKTVLAIAHRLSTVRNADRIIVIEQGSIIEGGPHDDLIAASGAYARLIQHQAIPEA